MKKTVFVLTATALLATGIFSVAQADGRHYRQDGVYLDNGDETGGYLVQDRRYYDHRSDYGDRYGPRDVARMLEDRGYRVRNVDFDRGRYFVRASRRGAPVLVVVSRRGEILETRRMGGDRYSERPREGFSIQINPAY